MAFCSAVTLCFAAICAVVSAALLAIAFSTDNWQVISVERAKLNVSRYYLHISMHDAGSIIPEQRKGEHVPRLIVDRK